MNSALAKLAQATGQLTPRGWASLRWAELVVTDRRWAAPLASMALGFGLLVGIVLGPGSSGSQAASPAVVQVPAEQSEEAPAPAEDATASTGAGSSPPGSDGSGTGTLDTASTIPPVAPAPLPVAPVAPVAPAPAAAPPAAAPAEETSTTASEETEPEEEGDSLAGAVVSVNEAASSYSLVAAGGLLYAVHAKKLPAAGSKVDVPVAELANGTYVEDGKRATKGKVSSTTFTGVATFVDADPEAPAYTLSRIGASVRIKVEPEADGTLPELPKIGSFVEVTASIREAPAADATIDETDDPTADPVTPAPASCAAAADDSRLRIAEPATVLVQSKVQVDPEPFDYTDVAGVLTATCDDTGEIALSADDMRSTDSDVILKVPSEIDVGAYEIGDSLAATAEIADDGSLELAGLASDEGIAGADDGDLLQGDLGG